MVTYCGKTHDEMKKILYTMMDLEDTLALSFSEREAFDVSIQCISTIINRMTDNKLVFEDIEN